MRHLQIACALVVAALAGSPIPAAAQAAKQANPPKAMATTGVQELYEAHFVKAAPGKMREMIDAYVNAPADPSASAPPLVLRHVEGDDWDLLVLTPYGKEDKMTLAPMSAAEQQWIARTRPLRATHTDTIVVGPAWSETRTALAAQKSDVETAGTAGTSGDRNVYIVTTYRALPGHRDQLEQVLTKLAALRPGRTVTMQHMEGAAWDFVSVTRYASWSDFASDEMTPDMQALRAQGFTGPEGPSLALREHMAEHHDTIAVPVERAPK